MAGKELDKITKALEKAQKQIISYKERGLNAVNDVDTLKEQIRVLEKEPRP